MRERDHTLEHHAMLRNMNTASSSSSSVKPHGPTLNAESSNTTPAKDLNAECSTTPGDLFRICTVPSPLS